MADYVIHKTSNVNFDLYSIEERNKERKRDVRTVVVNAHGNFTPDHSMPRPPPKPMGYLPEQHGAANKNFDKRLSYMTPPAKEFQLRSSLCLLGQHGCSLAGDSHHKSILQDLIESAIVGDDLYSPGRRVTDYVLADVSDRPTEYGGRLLSRRDFVKVLLIEAMIIRQQEEAAIFLRDMEQKYRGRVLIPVPDIAIITSKAVYLSTVLGALPQYTTVFGHFCRSDRTRADRGTVHPHYVRRGGLVKSSKRAELERTVLEKAKGFLTP